MKRQTNWALIVSIVFIHFMFAIPAGFPLTIAPFAIVFFLLFQVKPIVRLQGVYLVIVLLLWPIVVFSIYTLLGGNSDMLEFSKTYLLWVFLSFALVACPFSVLRKWTDYSREFIITLFLIGAFSLAQVVFAKVLGSSFLYNPFGTFSYMHEYDVAMMVGRSPGFFLEPSFNAFVMFFLISVILMGNRNAWRFVWVSGVGICMIAVTGSASGECAILVLVTLWAITTVVKHRALRVVAFLMIPLLLLVVGKLFLTHRFAEFAVAGTSGYWRLIAPLIILRKALFEYPLGVSFGQVENFILPLGLQHGSGVGSSLDNGMFLLVFYFGWLGVLLVFGFLYKIVQSVYYADMLGVIFWWYIIASLQFSGGVFLPEYIFPLMLVLFQYRRVKYWGTALDLGINTKCAKWILK